MQKRTNVGNYGAIFASLCALAATFSGSPVISHARPPFRATGLGSAFSGAVKIRHHPALSRFDQTPGAGKGAETMNTVTTRTTIRYNLSGTISRLSRVKLPVRACNGASGTQPRFALQENLFPSLEEKQDASCESCRIMDLIIRSSSEADSPLTRTADRQQRARSIPDCSAVSFQTVLFLTA